MEMFRPLKGGGASVWLSPGEATLLRTLVVPVVELLNDPARPGPPADTPSGDTVPADTVPADTVPADTVPADTVPADTGTEPAAGAGDAGQADLFADLEKMFNETAAAPPAAPADPVLARLLPDAYSDDPEAAGEFRRYTESSLREAKKYFAQTLLETLPAKGGRVKLSAEQARDWLRALNDVRLMFGVRLEVTEDFEDQLAGLDPKDPRVAAFEVYGWLGAVQESLVRAIAR
jgi:hypothetical protein